MQRSLGQKKLETAAKERTQVVLAIQLGISQPALSELIRTPGRSPSARVLLACERVLGIRSADWFEYEEEASSDPNESAA